jgi:RNA polymerase sigma factor (sigma-70 family)
VAKELRNKDYWQLVWIKFKAGDRNSFEEIYNEFADSLFAYGSKITSDRELLKDCIQDLFIDIYKYSPNIKNPELLEFYLYKSLKHLIVKKLQKDKQLGFGFDSYSFDLIFNSENDGYQDDSRNEQIELLQKAIGALDDKKRELLFLKFNSGLNYNEIGDLLNMKPDTVKKQVQRIIQYLRSNFGPSILELVFVCFKA